MNLFKMVGNLSPLDGYKGKETCENLVHVALTIGKFQHTEFSQCFEIHIGQRHVLELVLAITNLSPNHFCYVRSKLSLSHH